LSLPERNIVDAIDMEARHLKMVRAVLARHLPLKQVWAYGSRVKWSTKQNSDLDCVVFGADDRELMYARVAFDESAIPFIVQILSWESIPAEFKDNIKQEYYILQTGGDWPEVKLGEIAAIIAGQSPQGIFYNENGVGAPFYQGIKDYGERYLKSPTVWTTKVTKMAQPGDILMSVRAPVGAINITKDEVCIGRGLAAIRGLNGTHRDYLYYFLTYISDMVVGNEGTLFDSINKTQIENIKIALPPLAEQKAIADVLSSFDDKIELLNRQNETLEATAQALFRRRFIDNARADWQAAELKDIYAFEKGCEPGSDNYLQNKTANSVRFIRVGDMLARQAALFVDKALCDAVCDETDVLVSFDGTVGRVVFGVQGCYSSGIRKIYARDEAFNNMGFKFLLFKSDSIQREIQENAIGTVILHASSSIEHLTFAYKDKEQIERFNRAIEPMFERMLSNLRQIGALERLRDALLPKLMSGSVRIA